MKKIFVLLVFLSCLCSCSIPKIDRVHIKSEQQCIKVKSGIVSAKYYVYVNGKRYRRNDVIAIRENELCPYCEVEE